MEAHTLLSVMRPSGILFQLNDLSTCVVWGMDFRLPTRGEELGSSVIGGGAPGPPGVGGGGGGGLWRVGGGGGGMGGGGAGAGGAGLVLVKGEGGGRSVVGMPSRLMWCLVRTDSSWDTRC